MKKIKNKKVTGRQCHTPSTVTALVFWSHHSSEINGSSQHHQDQALSFWSGSTDSKILDYQRIHPREYQIVRTPTKETTSIPCEENKY